MDPVNVNIFDIGGGHVGGGEIAFGAAVYRSAAKTVKGCPCGAAASNMVGIAVDDMVEKTVDGFYAQYDAIPLAAAGRCRVWITPNHTTAVDLVAGDNLELAVLASGTNTLPVGVFEAAGSAAPATRTAETLARLEEDVTLYDNEVIAANVAVDDVTVTMTGSGLIDDLVVGDYILLEDIAGAVAAGVGMNRVKSKDSATQITLVKAAGVVLTVGSSDLIHKLVQGEVMLI